MNNGFLLILLILIFSCGQKKSNSELEKPVIDSMDKLESRPTVSKKDSMFIDFGNIPSRATLEFNKPTVLIVTMDSLEIEQAKIIDGEDNFYTGTDDLMWYNAMMLKKMDSLDIDVNYTEKDTVIVKTTNFNKTITKDSTFTVYTYFYFDGQRLNKTDLFKLLGE